ncbi:MAG: DNA-3-methyladenine glycosylase 2 family protein [Candidatus Magasanikbacteria bacterium]|nr:DNA-3-methyladenine glycosylase 2 family protein [Candidatus Magasanikbacteria bacterium]
MSVAKAQMPEAMAYLKKSDPVLAKLFGKVQPCVLRPSKNYFESLTDAIISQQLSGKAAATIFKRFKALFNDGRFPLPAEVLAKSDAELRSVGVSGSKATYIKNIAAGFEDGLLNFKHINKKTDEEIVEMLVKIKGIGRWTAEMFLIFSLGRPDVFSFGDLGLRNAVKKVYGLRKDPSPARLKQLSAKWCPHRTCASLYLWASLDNRL